jgi:hypothetical protein
MDWKHHEIIRSPPLDDGKTIDVGPYLPVQKDMLSTNPETGELKPCAASWKIVLMERLTADHTLKSFGLVQIKPLESHELLERTRKL